MSELRVAVSGAGKMGRQVIAALRDATDMSPVACLDGLGAATDVDGLPRYADAAACFAAEKVDVVVDFTNAAWTPRLADAALPRGVRMVIGTTGLDAEFLERLGRQASAHRAGVVVASNFAISAVLMMHFARQAARFFDYAEIVELHHEQKVDSPSGTARTTAQGMVEARGRPFIHPESEIESIPGARGAELGGVAIHSVRLPGMVAHQEVIFGGLGQTLTIRQDSTGRDSYMPGVLAAVRAVMDRDRLVLGLDELFGLA